MTSDGVTWPPSLWAAATPPGPDLPALRGAEQAEAVVIGAPAGTADAGSASKSAAVPGDSTAALARLMGVTVVLTSSVSAKLTAVAAAWEPVNWATSRTKQQVTSTTKLIKISCTPLLPNALPKFIHSHSITLARTLSTERIR